MTKFDQGIKPGDIITANHAGFHRVTKVKRRYWTKNDDKYHRGRIAGQEYSSLICYITILTKDYKPSKGKKEKGCDAGFCVRLNKKMVTERRAKLLEQIKQGFDTLLDSIKEP